MPSVKNCTYNVRTEDFYQYEYRTYTQSYKKIQPVSPPKVFSFRTSNKRRAVVNVDKSPARVVRLT